MIRNILFDLGNVIVDLDIPHCTDQLNNLMRHPDRQDENQAVLVRAIQDYEVAAISDELFINSIINISKPQVYAQQVIRAWNSMLIDIPEQRLEYLKELKSEGYNIYLLSNTNAIHLDWVNQFIRKHYRQDSLNHWFDRAYYSHLIQRRKPDISTFEYVIGHAGIQPHETLFIDDIYENIESGKQAGLHTIHLTGGHDMIGVLKNYLKK